MLITGVAVVVVNMNPLIKLDGYYAFSEILGFSDIKEKSTAYLSSWVRRYVFRLPVEVEYVPRRRRTLYVVYAILSGLYSYALLFAVVRFSRNVFLNYSREWAFLPALALAYFIFRSRIRAFVRFMKTVYLDKKDRVMSWLNAMADRSWWRRYSGCRTGSGVAAICTGAGELEPIRRETRQNGVCRARSWQFTSARATM